MIVCIPCAMQALLAGQPSPTFDETMEAHLARCHPDPAATQRERKELERRFTERFNTGEQQ